MMSTSFALAGTVLWLVYVFAEMNSSCVVDLLTRLPLLVREHSFVFVDVVTVFYDFSSLTLRCTATRFCRDANSLTHLEDLLHCDGIWLHALRYSGKDWSFETKYPDWAQGF